MKHPLIFLAVIIIVTILLGGCGEPRRALKRTIVCDGEVIGVTVIPEGGIGYGPTIREGGRLMGFIDIDSREWTLVNIVGCKRIEIKNEFHGYWKDIKKR